MTNPHDEFPARPTRYRRAFGTTLTVETQADAREALSRVPDAIVVVRRHRPRTVVFNCPDGCGEVLLINVDPSAGQAWRFREDQGQGVTLMPSVWRTSGCGAHFVLWQSEIWWCRFFDDVEDGEGARSDLPPHREVADEPWPAEMDAELRDEWQRIRAKWRRRG